MDEIGMDNIIKYLDDDHPGRKIDLTDNTSQFLFFIITLLGWPILLLKKNE